MLKLSLKEGQYVNIGDDIRIPNRVRGWNRKALSITDRCSQRTEYRKIQQRTGPGEAKRYILSRT